MIRGIFQSVTDERGDGALDGEGIAEAGVDVDEERHIGHARGDALDVGAHVGEIGDAEVGKAVRRGGDAGAGEVQRLDAGSFGEKSAESVDGADVLQAVVLLDGTAEQGMFMSDLSSIALLSDRVGGMRVLKGYRGNTGWRA